jgi:hypothetical protein
MTRARSDATVLLVVGVLASGCLRAPIGDDSSDLGSGSGGEDDEDGSTGLGASDSPFVDDSSGETSTGPEDACHPSYVPCLPSVDDLNCSDVVALGAAPVMVIGADDYDLDSDHDGVGCEQ